MTTKQNDVRAIPTQPRASAGDGPSPSPAPIPLISASFGAILAKAKPQ